MRYLFQQSNPFFSQVIPNTILSHLSSWYYNDTTTFKYCEVLYSTSTSNCSQRLFTECCWIKTVCPEGFPYYKRNALKSFPTLHIFPELSWNISLDKLLRNIREGKPSPLCKPSPAQEIWNTVPSSEKLCNIVIIKVFHNEYKDTFFSSLFRLLHFMFYI